MQDVVSYARAVGTYQALYPRFALSLLDPGELSSSMAV